MEWKDALIKTFENPVFIYKFSYKDKHGIMQIDHVSVSKNDNELAIAAFEKQFPNNVWREFELVLPPKQKDNE